MNKHLQCVLEWLLHHDESYTFLRTLFSVFLRRPKQVSFCAPNRKLLLYKVVLQTPLEVVI